MGSKNGSVSRKTQTDSLGKRVHGVGSEHTRAASATRAGTLFYLLHLLVRNAGISTLDHCGNQVGILAFPAASLHWTTRAEHGRDIQSHRCHEHTWSHLVTVGDADHGIRLVSIDHIFHRISDDVTAWQRIEHSVVAHSDTIIHSDGIKLGCIATHSLNFLLDNLTNLVKMSMTWNKLCKAVHDSDDWLAKLLMFHTCSYPECTGTCHSSAFSTDATS